MSPNTSSEPNNAPSESEEKAAPVVDKTSPFPFPTADNHDNPPVIEQPVLQDTSEDALDAGVEESFPASDPVSVTVTKVVPVVAKDEAQKQG